MTQSIEIVSSKGQGFLYPDQSARTYHRDMADGFGLRIRAARMRANLTQEACAEKVGRTKQNWSHYEKERQEPSFAVLEKFCDLVDVSADYIITGRPSYVMSPEIAEVCKRLTALERDKLDAVLTLISNGRDDEKVAAFSDPKKRPK